MRSPAGLKLSALTPEKVPTPPDAAQAPELSPFETEMPLPPSTSGNTSRPEMTSDFRAFTRAPRRLARARLERLAAVPGGSATYVLFAWAIIKRLLRRQAARGPAGRRRSPRRPRRRAPLLASLY